MSSGMREKVKIKIKLMISSLAGYAIVSIGLLAAEGGNIPPHCDELLARFRSEHLIRSPSELQLSLAANVKFRRTGDITTAFSIHLPEAIYQFELSWVQKRFEGFQNNPTNYPTLDLLYAGIPLKSFGEKVSLAMNGATVFDMGSGTPETSVDVPYLAKKFGAKRYVGVDLFLHRERAFGGGQHPWVPESVYIQADHLQFLSQLEYSGRKLFVFIGFEAYDREQSKAYIAELMQEITRLARSGDGVLLGRATFGINPESYGFHLEASEKNHFLYLKP